MTDMKDIVQIDITRETAAVTQTNFEIPLFLATHANFTERARVYGSITAVGADFPATSKVYKAAQAAFAQQIKPDSLVIGRRALTSTSVTVSVPVGAPVGTTFTLTINNTPYVATLASGDDAADIADKLETAYGVGQVGITVVAATDTVVITPTAGTVAKIQTGTNLTENDALSGEDIVAAYAAVKAENDTFYLVTTDSRDEDEVEDLADAIESEKKIFGTSILPTEAGTSVDTDLLSRLKAKSLFRTYVLVSNTADTEYGELAWGAYQIQEQPGSNTWAYKTLSLVSTSKLSATQTTNINAKNGNTYEMVGGSGTTLNGKTVGGEWIDVMVFVDWLEARMRERIYFRLKNSKKLPMTNSGIAIIESDVRAQLTEGVRVGGLDNTPPFTVVVPDVLSLSPNTRAQRILEGVTFNARLAGGIHITRIAGVVAV